MYYRVYCRLHWIEIFAFNLTRENLANPEIITQSSINSSNVAYLPRDRDRSPFAFLTPVNNIDSIMIVSIYHNHRYGIATALFRGNFRNLSFTCSFAHLHSTFLLLTLAIAILAINQAMTSRSIAPNNLDCS